MRFTLIVTKTNLKVRYYYFVSIIYIISFIISYFHINIIKYMKKFNSLIFSSVS